MYRLVRNALFCLPAEWSHDIALQALAAKARLHLPGLAAHPPPAPVSLMGLRLPHPVGLAAGLDKNADYLDGLAACGFGFIEVGTVTPRPQPGNPRPRLFRLPEHEALINRMGFNNKGIDHLVARVEASRFRGVLGINIGKNRDTPLERAVDDYRHCMRKAWRHASYITVNLSSPNTPGLRDLQFGEPLKRLLEALKQEQAALEAEYRRAVPVAVKIAPDMADADIVAVAAAFREHGIEGVIATNTTIDREAVAGARHADEIGGLSGRPLAVRSTAVLARLAAELGATVPIIGVGGICDGETAAAKLRAGAVAVQLYTGFIYRGPALIDECAAAIAAGG